jgi:hypothetical protein
MLPQFSLTAVQDAQMALARRRAAVEGSTLETVEGRFCAVPPRVTKRTGCSQTEVVSITTRRPISDLEAALAKLGGAVAEAERRRDEMDSDE